VAAPLTLDISPGACSRVELVELVELVALVASWLDYRTVLVELVKGAGRTPEYLPLDPEGKARATAGSALSPGASDRSRARPPAVRPARCRG
jgi:hypothetical protein